MVNFMLFLFSHNKFFKWRTYGIGKRNSIGLNILGLFSSLYYLKEHGQLVSQFCAMVSSSVITGVFFNPLNGL